LPPQVLSALKASDMLRKLRISRWFAGAVVLAVVECAAVAAVQLAFTDTAHAQFRRHQYRSGGFFEQLFGGPFNQPRNYQRQEEPSRSAPSQHVDHSRAPNGPKTEKDETPSTTIVVMGDGMSDWLGYGLDDAFSDDPGVAIVRKDKQRSGLIRYDAKSTLDWWHAVRDILSKQKANYVVMMLGLNDRESIRERDVAKEDETRKAEKEQAKNAANKDAQKKDQAGAAQDKKPDKKNEQDKKTIAAPEPKTANGIIEFRSDLWAKVYSRRIDETIAALKSKGVPVFWVGLPSIRGTKSTADAVYLNDLFRARAERAGINYIDVWDGFVDESGKYSTYGPDYEGQTRRLRSADGVFFTKSGARKLAHYVEREIRRYMSNRSLQVVLPSGPLTPTPEGGKPAARPVIGPVIPLTATTGTTDQLLGGANTRPTYGDAIANDVLVKGESIAAPAGRADNFVWQHGGTANNAGGMTNNAQKSSAQQPAGEKRAVVLPTAAPNKRTVRQIDINAGNQNQSATPNPTVNNKDAGKAAEPEKTAQKESAAEQKAAQEAQAAPKPERHTTTRRRVNFPFNPFNLFR
jgi:hypothetical protein